VIDLHGQSLYDVRDTEANCIVAKERNPRKVSTKLITHFGITKEDEDKILLTKKRKGQDHFRRMILANYGGLCAVTGIDITQLLLANHIIPWTDKSHKSDPQNPCNGICLSALYDKAFSQGIITISPNGYCVVLSSAGKRNERIL
jgi:putative restriction endonuclease